MTNSLAPFTTYADARRRLLASIEDLGAPVSSAVHPQRGPEGEDLATDVIRFGAPIGEADHVVFVQSGTHGVEGFAGNALQLNLVASGRLTKLPDRTAVVIVHAVNPWGMAYTRRVDADNIDVNRNFVDPQHLPANDLYAQIDPLLNPTDEVLDLADGSYVNDLLTFWASVGDHQAMKAISGGQYSHPRGVQFGGQNLSWSRRALEGIWAEHLDGSVQSALILDVHTGLGPEGRLTVFQTADANEPAAEAGARWYPEYLYRSDRSEHDPIDHGLLGPGFDAWAAARGDAASGIKGPAQTGTFVIEFGTRDPISAVGAFRADNWLHHYGDRTSELGQTIVASMRDVFWIDDESWTSAVAEQGHMAIHTALDGINDLS